MKGEDVNKSIVLEITDEEKQEIIEVIEKNKNILM